jgi:hypothetical protein
LGGERGEGEQHGKALDHDWLRVEENFSDAIICAKTLSVYESLIPTRSQS